MIRTCVDRLAGDGNHTIADEMDEVAVKALHRINVRNNNGDPDEAGLEIKYRKLRVLPPIGKQKRYPALTLTVIHAEERMTPKNRKKIEWKLITNLPVSSRTDAIEKLEWYALRWKIEVFHKILKSGCKAEESNSQDRPASDQSDLALLHPELAGLLDDDAQPFGSRRAANLRVDRD